jgi:hypothetical protein
MASFMMSAHFRDDLEQQRFLLVVHLGDLQPFGADLLAILAGAEHEVSDLIAKHGFRPLLRIERLQQGKRLIALTTE